MLSIIYGDVKNSIYNTNIYFKNSYEPEWLETELVQILLERYAYSEIVGTFILI